MLHRNYSLMRELDKSLQGMAVLTCESYFTLLNLYSLNIWQTKPENNNGWVKSMPFALIMHANGFSIINSHWLLSDYMCNISFQHIEPQTMQHGYGYVSIGGIQLRGYENFLKKSDMWILFYYFKIKNIIIHIRANNNKTSLWCCVFPFV